MAAAISGSRRLSSDTCASRAQRMSRLVDTDLLQPRDVASALECGFEPDLEPAHDLLVVRVRAAPQGDHIGVVVEPRQARGLGAGDKGGANPDDLVRHDRLADATAAEHDAP